jgi:fructose-1,6-bisphosphatase/inositol monophosphatase family enzyme
MNAHYPDSTFLIDIAHDAGEIITSHFNLNRDWIVKEDSTPLTKADTLINAMVLARFERDYPHINVIAEEGNREVAGAEYTALVDPIDGTTGYALGIPVSAFCATILKGDKPIAAVIFDPFQARMWLVSEGDGTTLNGKRVSVSEHRELKNSHVMLVKWYGCGFNLGLVELQLMEQGSKVQNITSLAYFGGLIASGTVEASIFPGRGALETAAMQAIIEGAGGLVTDLHGDRILYQSGGYKLGKGALASNGVIHDKLLQFTHPPLVLE